MSKMYQGKNGEKYIIVEPPIASGGEGYIYAISGWEEQVLKIFKSEKRTRQREEKLLKMVEYQLNEQQLQQVTWPQDVIYDESGFAGYVMPRLLENKNLNVVYSTQNNNLDLRHRMLIAYNLCAAVDTVHSFNQVCGDLNPQNICVNFNLESEYALKVTLVDTDSYHIIDGNKIHRCEVGLTNYLAPEIQKKLENGQDLKSADLPTYTKETDLFALAVHIFALLMNGCHPFACAKQTSSGFENTMSPLDDTNYDSVVLPQPIENIRDGFFPFHQERIGVTYPLYAPDFHSLPGEIQNLFVRAFENGYINPMERPTTEEWLTVLRKYQSPIYLRQCEERHFYLGIERIECPYCAAHQRMIQMMRQSIPEVSKQLEAAYVQPMPLQQTSPVQITSPPKSNVTIDTKIFHDVEDIDNEQFGIVDKNNDIHAVLSKYAIAIGIFVFIVVGWVFMKIADNSYIEYEENIGGVESNESKGTADEISIDEINFPDEVFRSYISYNYDANKNGYLSVDEVDSVQVLAIPYENIEDLTGINYLGNLEVLLCGNNSLTSLDVSRCTNLQKLYCNNNSLTSLDVSRCTNLEVLDCSNNNLTSLDVNECASLQELDCSNNSLTSLDVNGCASLQELDCSNNSLTSLDVSRCTNLESLFYYDNKLDAVDISVNPNLE